MATSRGDAARQQRRKWGLYPSRDLDVPTALHLFEWSHYRFARSTEALPADAIRRVLDALRRERPTDPCVHFLHVAVDATALQPTWRAAVNALKQCQAESSWGSKEKREKLSAIAKDPALLAAVQSAAVACTQVPLEFLAILVLDGGDASTDAVLPHFDRAMKDPVTLDALARLSTFTKGKPAFAAMMRTVDERTKQRTERSAVLALADQLGIASGTRFRVQVRMEGTPRANVWCDVQLDSASAQDFVVWLSTGVGKEASLTHFATSGLVRDDLELGACAPKDLPAWLARAETELGLRWNRTTARASFLRGQRLDTFLAWLFTPGAAAPNESQSNG